MSTSADNQPRDDLEPPRPPSPQTGDAGKAHKPPQERVMPKPRRGLSDYEANYPDGTAPSSGGPARRSTPDHPGDDTL